MVEQQFASGDRVRLVSTLDDTRSHLVGVLATVAQVLAGNETVLAGVAFDGHSGRWTMVRGVDELELVEAAGTTVSFLPRR
ncbi:MAG: hypothetical protein ACKVHU_11285 [Acidimicrobiales bacterium]|jgi:hypothetical protein